MNATELLNQAADLIERDGWRTGDGGSVGAKCVGNAIYSVWSTNHTGIPFGFGECFDAVYEVIGVDDLDGIYGWNDTVCLDQAEAVNTLRKAAENVGEVKR